MRMTLREIDALVAEKIMGLSKEHWESRCLVERHGLDGGEWCYDCHAPVDRGESVPDLYSSDIADAWQVIQRFEHCTIEREYGAWKAEICCAKGETHSSRQASLVVPGYAEADTAPLAICLAALASVGITVNQSEVPNASRG